jgi:hypothetical protein
MSSLLPQLLLCILQLSFHVLDLLPQRFNIGLLFSVVTIIGWHFQTISVSSTSNVANLFCHFNFNV